MNRVATTHGADGRNLPAAQPAGGVSGSPFSVGDASASGPSAAITGLILVHPTGDVHVKFSKDGTDATTSDFLLPAGQVQAFPMDADHVSFIAPSGGSPTVYVEKAKEK